MRAGIGATPTARTGRMTDADGRGAVAPEEEREGFLCAEWRVVLGFAFAAGGVLPPAGVAGVVGVAVLPPAGVVGVELLVTGVVSAAGLEPLPLSGFCV